ncbi:hypothetical protein [Pontibacter burrus]|uniref:Outer membrane protein beta-barrel domain-containing protein n=1 Tax=Pontibacter burrus TaxID=2704466 RepID=A0A6B3LSY5_9BACT|nr:hypothetical protein [Pontibacter burrus]NEM96580.1 hypothetical protein [Pontibacter burrus]
MNKLLLSLLLLVCSLTTYAQVTFEPGYFIDNNGTRIDCLIRNTDKSSNPTLIEYKLTEEGKAQTESIDNIQAFEILNTIHKYKRFIVNIDRSSDNLRELHYVREPEFKSRQLFLRVLLEGDITLYVYKEPSLTRFFYQIGDAQPEQLVYKKYMHDVTSFRENKAFQQQLWMALQCPSFTMEQFSKLNYEERNLVRIFKEYYSCTGQQYTDHALDRTKDVFSFRVGAGVGLGALELYNGKSSSTLDMGVGLAPQVFGEIVYTLPFNKRQWEIFIKPTFVYFKKKGKAPVFGPNAEIESNLSHVMLPLGLRKSFYLNTDVKFLLSSAVAVNNLVFKKEVLTIIKDGKKGFDTFPNSYYPSLVVGTGFSFRNKFAVEANYYLANTMGKGAGAYYSTQSDTIWKPRLASSYAVALSYTLK